MTFTRIINFFSFSKIQRLDLGSFSRCFSGRKKGQKGKTLRDHRSEYKKAEREEEKAFQQKMEDEWGAFQRGLDHELDYKISVDGNPFRKKPSNPIQGPNSSTDGSA